MKKSWTLRIIAVLVSSALQVACGGGGGGGSAPASSPPVSPPPSPPVSPLGSLTAARGVDLAFLSLSGLELASNMSEAMRDFARILRLSNLSVQTFPCGPNGEQRLAADDADQSGSLSAGDAITLDVSGCSNADLSIRLDITDYADGATGILRLIGRMSIDIGGLAGTEAEFSLAFTEDSVQQRMLITDLHIELTPASGPATQAITQGIVDRITQTDGSYGISVSGETESSALGGEFRFATLESLIGDTGGYPAEGALEFRGRDLRVVLRPSDDAIAVVGGAIDFFSGAVGTSQLSAFQSSRWAEMLFLTPFGGRLNATEFPTVNPPDIDALEIQPANPYTTDPLDAVASVADNSGLPLTTLYEWWRDGRRFWSSNTSSLPAIAHVKDQTIVVSVTASTPLGASREIAATTILDTPAVISMPQESYSADDGLPLQFSISAFDADGDVFGASSDDELIVAHGPAGMTIDPVTRTVSWTPSGPRFGPLTEYHFEIGTVGGLVAPLDGSISVAGAAPLFNDTRAHAQVVRPLIANLRGDARDEILAVGANTLYELAWNGSAYETLWTLPFNFDALNHVRGVAAHDVTGDGIPEIFLSQGPHVIVLAGDTRLPINTIDLGAHYCGRLEITDLAADGTPELLCRAHSATEPGGFHAYAPDTLNRIWRHDTVVDDFVIANFDADPALEIATSFGSIIDGASGLQQGIVSGSPFYNVAAADLDGNGVPELIALNHVDQTLRAYSVTQDLMFSEFPGAVSGYALTVFDHGGDGNDDILIVDESGGNLYRHDAGLGQLTLSANYPELAATVFNGMLTSATGIDDDGGREIIIPSAFASLTIAELEPTLDIEWTNSSDGHVRAPWFGGELATSLIDAPAIIFGASTGLSAEARLIALDPATGSYTISPAIGDFFPDPHLTVADVDADGTDESLLGAVIHRASPPGEVSRFVAYDSFANAPEWSLDFDAMGYVAAGSIDSNGDSRAELVGMTADGRVGIYDLLTGSELWLSDAFASPLPARLVDTDGDGTPEIVVADDAGVYRLDRDAGTGYTETASYDFGGSDSAISLTSGDSDGDGLAEVFVLGSSGTVYRLDGDLTAATTFAAPAGTHDIYMEALGAGQRNLLAATADFSSGGDGAYLVAVDARRGGEVWRSPRLIGQQTPGSLHYVDLAGKGLQITVATDKGFYLTQ